MHFSSKKAYENTPGGFLVFAICGKMVGMMKYKTVNQRDENGDGRDENRLSGFIREIRAIRGSLPELHHGFHGCHGFPAAWPRLVWVKPVALSRTQSNRSNGHKWQPTDPAAGPGGLLGKGRTSVCKSLIFSIFSDISSTSSL
jgi:hypothetical protein